MDLRVLPERLSVCRLPVDAPWPVPSPGTSFYSVTRTADEVSVVCTDDQAPTGDHVRVEPDRAAAEHLTGELEEHTTLVVRHVRPFDGGTAVAPVRGGRGHRVVVRRRRGSGRSR